MKGFTLGAVLQEDLLIDLKICPFRHGDAGQMNFYLNYWKDQVMAEGDNPPVGLPVSYTHLTLPTKRIV